MAAAAAAATSVSSHVSAGRLAAALDALDAAAAAAAPLPASLFSNLLRLCVSRHSLFAARHVVSHLTATTFSSPSSSSSSRPPSTFLVNRAIEALAACGGLADARKLFDDMPCRDGGSWNAIIAASSRAGHPRDALASFADMNKAGIPSKHVTLASVLACCSEVLDLRLARQVHALIAKREFCTNVILGTALIDVYGKCRSVEDARRVFDDMPHRNAISWNVMVRRYLEADKGVKAVDTFFRMIRTGLRPLSFTVSSALLACRDTGALVEGQHIHAFAFRHGYEREVLVRNSIVEMYAKCGAIDSARRLFDMSAVKDVVLSTSMVSGYAACGRIAEAEEVFEGMTEHNVISWNAMLNGYVKCADYTSAMDLFRRMRSETDDVDAITLGSVLNACTGLLDLAKGTEVHGFACKCGFRSHLYSSNALLAMYAKCGSLRSAEVLLFDEMASLRDSVSWNSLISGYERHSMSEEALHALRTMLSENTPTELTFSSALAACANIFLLNHGKQIHAYIIRSGFEIDDILRTALIDMYSKCRLIDCSIRVFESKVSNDVILWSTMIFGYAYNGRGNDGLELFEEMRKKEITPDVASFLAALVSCISEGHVNLGRSYFNLMTEEYGIIPRLEHYECMIELLGKNNCMVELEDFVQRMPFEPTTAMWTRIFDCCREYGNRRLGEKAAERINETKPLNPVRFVALSDAETEDCSSGSVSFTSQ